MAAPIASQILFAAGGDVLSKYGTLCWRKGLPTRGGEIPYTFTRAGNGLYVASDTVVGGTWKGLIASANTARVEQAIDPVTGLLQNYLVVEGAGTNLIQNSDFEADIVGTSADVGATLVRDNAQVFSSAWALKITTNNVFSGVIFRNRDASRIPAAAATTYTFSAWIFNTSTGAGQLRKLSIDWYNAGGGVISTSAGPSVAMVAGWQRITYTVTSPALTVTAVPYADFDGSNGVFSLWMDVPQFEAFANATSAIPTLTVAVTRNTEVFTVPWYVAPRECWVYLRFLERGTINQPSGTKGLFYIGSASGADPSFSVYQNGNKYFVNHGNGVSTVGGPMGTAPVFGNVVELLALLRADGSVELRQSINGATETTSGQSAALAFANAWNGFLFILGAINTAGGTGLTAFSRALVGLGAGTTVQTIADVRSAL